MNRIKDAGWRYWLASAAALTGGVAAGWQWGFATAIALTLIQIIHFRIRTGSFASFPVQIRLTYLAILLVAAPAPL